MDKNITTGIVSREQLTHRPYGHRVDWIAWDSDFRNTDLDIGDIIVGVNDYRYDIARREEDSTQAVGSHNEAAYWKAQSGEDGQEILLRVWRAGEEREIRGKLRADRFYYDEDNSPALGPGGPNRLKNDGFQRPWSGWYEQFVKTASQHLVDRWWERSSFNNQLALKAHQEEKVRVDYLLSHYPGPFAEAVQQDWERVAEVLQGRTYDITPEMLSYRELGEKRIAQVKAAARQAREQFEQEHRERMMDAFPVIDPVVDDRSAVAGKLVALPAVTFRQFINDLGKSYAVIGSRHEGYYFADLNSPEMTIFFDTLFRYQSLVTAEITEKYQFIAEVQDDPHMLTHDGRPTTGLMVKVVAATVGSDELFVDLRSRNGEGVALFAGEAELSDQRIQPLTDQATPAQVIETMIESIKRADRETWKSLQASWRVFERWGAPPIMDTNYYINEGSLHSMWEHSRRLILNEVYDGRVVYIYPIITVVENRSSLAMPKVEETKVIVDHIGCFDGIYQSFSNIKVNRSWILQRLDGGPWKIINPQHL